MKKIFFASVTLAIVLLAAPVFAQFEPSKGIFKGQFENREYDLNVSKSTFVDYFKTNDKMALWCMGKYKVSYAFWMLLGEPVCDYKFYWEFDKDALIQHEFKNSLYKIRIRDFDKYPDLKKEFLYITPMPNIQISVLLECYAPGSEKPTATLYHTINIDLPDRAGVTDNFSVPGSDDWDKMFSVSPITDNKGLNNNNLSGNFLLSKEGNAAFKKDMQNLFKSINRIEVAKYLSPRLMALKWNQFEIKSILDEYCRREGKATLAKTQAKTAVGNKKEDDFWNTTGSTSTTSAASDDDFWNTTNSPIEQWTGKLDKAETLYNQKQWKEARALYQDVASINPNQSYASNKVKFIDKLLAYKPKSDDTFTDPRDGKTYKIVQIGDQTWMAENLKYEIGKVSAHIVNSYDYWRRIEEIGYFYAHDVACNVCPQGWKLPLKKDLIYLAEINGIREDFIDDEIVIPIKNEFDSAFSKCFLNSNSQNRWLALHNAYTSSNGEFEKEWYTLQDEEGATAVFWIFDSSFFIVTAVIKNYPLSSSSGYVVDNRIGFASQGNRNKFFLRVRCIKE